MDKLVPLILLALGLGAAHLAVGGLLKLRRDQPEFWLFGLGVRTKLGAVKVLFVAIALLFLAYTSYKRGSLKQILEPETTALQDQSNRLASQLQEAQKSVRDYQSQVARLTQEKEDCQTIVSRQGMGLAGKNDQVGELRASLGLRQKEVADLQANLSRLKEEMDLLQREHNHMSEGYRQTREKFQQLESGIETLRTEKNSLAAKLETAGQDDAELKRLREENGKLKSQYRDEERRASLLRQGLVLREGNDWALEQEIQRLANLIADQPDVSSPRQTDISRALQKINQVLREGSALTKQAMASDTKPPRPAQKTVNVPATKKN